MSVYQFAIFVQGGKSEGVKDVVHFMEMLTRRGGAFEFHRYNGDSEWIPYSVSTLLPVGGGLSTSGKLNMLLDYKSMRGAIKNMIQRGGWKPTYINPQTEEKENKMETKEMITTMQIGNGAKLVSCVYDFDTDNEAALYAVTSPRVTAHTWKNVIGLELSAGDYVVAENKNGLAVVKVVNPDLSPDKLTCNMGQLKHVIQKVDTADIDRLKKAEAKAVQALAMSAVTERLDKFREQVGASAFENVRIQLTGEVGLRPPSLDVNEKPEF